MLLDPSPVQYCGVVWKKISCTTSFPTKYDTWSSLHDTLTSLYLAWNALTIG